MTRLSRKLTAGIAMSVLPIAAIGVLAGNVHKQLGRTVELIEAPFTWTPFEADVMVTHPQVVPTYGRYYRSSDGSSRLETGPERDDMRLIYIQNVSARMTYTRNSRGWSQQPYDPMNGGAPLQIPEGLPGWKVHAKSVAVRRAFQNEPVAEALLAYEVRTGDTWVLKVPQLNFWDVVRRRPGREEVYTNIVLQEPTRGLFVPPAGVAIEERPKEVFSPNHRHGHQHDSSSE